MTLSNKHSRKIQVGGIHFRWIISPQDTQIIFVAVSADIKGQKIEVAIDSDINRFWVEFPHVSELNLRVVMPKDAENIITQALQLGWKPLEKGPLLRFGFREEQLHKYSFICGNI